MANLCNIVTELGLVAFSGQADAEAEVRGAYVSDLLSDVIGNAEKGSIWITIQTHLNIVAVASLKELPAIIIAGGHKPDSDTLERSKAENIAILGSGLDTFTLSGKLFKLLGRE